MSLNHETFSSQTQTIGNTNERLGRVLMCEGGLYTVAVESSVCDKSESNDTHEKIFCRAKGGLRHRNISPLAGDFVTVEALPRQDRNNNSYNCNRSSDSNTHGVTATAVISDVVNRRNALIRPPVANLDYIFVTMAAASPEPSLETIDKLICIAEYNKITPVIVIGKSELAPENAKKLYDIYSGAGFDCFSLSCHTGEGTDELRDYIQKIMKDKLVAFSGASGVGKSTLINLIYPGLNLMTSDISRKIERGRHTTRKVQLFEFFGGYIADTPGFSVLDFERFDFFGKEDLAGTFREFSDYLGKCRYTKCTHVTEDGCAIVGAVKEGKIAKSRHKSYATLFGILKNKNYWDKKQSVSGISDCRTRKE